MSHGSYRAGRPVVSICVRMLMKHRNLGIWWLMVLFAGSSRTRRFTCSDLFISLYNTGVECQAGRTIKPSRCRIVGSFGSRSVLSINQSAAVCHPRNASVRPSNVRLQSSRASRCARVPYKHQNVCGPEFANAFSSVRADDHGRPDDFLDDDGHVLRSGAIFRCYARGHILD